MVEMVRVDCTDRSLCQQAAWWNRNYKLPPLVIRVHVSVMVPVNEFSEVTVTPIEEEVCPAATLTLAGKTFIEKSPAITTGSGTYLGGEGVR